MDEYIRKEVFDERMARVDDENDRQNHRLSILEKNGETLNELVVSVKELALSVKQMQKEISGIEMNGSVLNQLTVTVEKLTMSVAAIQKEVEKNNSRLLKIEGEPADNWKKFLWLVFSGAVGLIVGYFLHKLGL